jgi:hypothetical protein
MPLATPNDLRLPGQPERPRRPKSSFQNRLTRAAPASGARAAKCFWSSIPYDGVLVLVLGFFSVFLAFFFLFALFWGFALFCCFWLFTLSTQRMVATIDVNTMTLLLNSLSLHAL